MEAATVILATTIALAFLTKILQRKLIDKKKMRELQNQMKEDQKKFREMLKEAEKNKKEIEELQQKMMQNNMELMNSNMKLSLFTMPAFLIAFWFLGTMYNGQTLVSVIELPTFSGFFLFNPLTWIPTGLSASTGYYKMYFFYYLGAALLMNLIEKVYEELKKMRAEK